MSDFSIINKQNGVVTLTLNRPEKRNAMSALVVKELLQQLTLAANDADTRVLIINGNGEHFCAGADIQWMQSIADSSLDENVEDAQLIADLMYRLYEFPKPTIVLAHGATMGGGLGLVSACDIAIGASNAFFAFSEVRIGITPSTISPYVIAAMGERAAKYYFLTGARFDAHEAMRIGLLHRVVDPANLMSEALAMTETLLCNGPKALTAAKQLTRFVAHEKISDQLSQKTAEHLANLRATPEAREGLRAYVEKRSPLWVKH